MAVYVPTGALGSGKTLWAISRIEEAMLGNCKIATNLDLILDKLPKSTAPVYRLPDFPTGDDLAAIGSGGEGRDERKWGWLVLDEGAAWLNSRGWGDKGRDAIVKWLLHARKHHWNVCLIIQGIGMLDKQIRQALVEYHVSCRRTDRLNVPLVGKLVHVLSLGYLTGRMPQVHMASTNYVAGGVTMHVENTWYKSKHLYEAYDTDQKLSSTYEHGLMCMLRDESKAQAVAIDTVAVPKVKPKNKIVEMMMRLPPDDRIKLYKRIQARGLDLAIC